MTGSTSNRAGLLVDEDDEVIIDVEQLSEAFKVLQDGLKTRATSEENNDTISCSYRRTDGPSYRDAKTTKS